MENQDQTVAVRYVGKKPTAQDNVAKSGKLWEGNGDVQWVTSKQAKILTRYADQWALDEAGGWGGGEPGGWCGNCGCCGGDGGGCGKRFDWPGGEDDGG